MKKLSLLEIKKDLETGNIESLPSFKIAILRNIMVEPFELYLSHYLFQMGFNAKITLGEYDNIYQDLMGENAPVVFEDTDCVFLFLKLETLSRDLWEDLTSLADEDIKSEILRVENHIASIIAEIRKKTKAMVLLQGFEFPVNPAYGIIDSQLENGQTKTIEKLNEYLKGISREETNVYFVDLTACMIRIGAQQYYDQRYWHIGKAPYSRLALQEIAYENAKFIAALKGKNKKCLVLDCDETLWGGIVAEDGLEGIKLGNTYPGSFYSAFQQEIVNLYNRGIIIAVCSKNNAEDVWEVFRDHPGMVLKEKHLATAQINWNDKASNLRQIASDLNIGLNSLVFIDDNPFEINLINEVLPEVETIQLDPKNAVKYKDILAGCGWFDGLTISSEDKGRGAMYRAEVQRKKLLTEITDMESYYHSLKMVITISYADDFSIPRIAQLTQKTNQFNLTTKRYNESDIQYFIEDPNFDVIYLRLSDRFGDSGIVGVVVLRHEVQKTIIDTFLLSCRVIGRGVEKTLLNHALALARKRTGERIIGEFRKSKKNSQVENFYPDQGFENMSVDSNQGGVFYEFDLKKSFQAPPAYFKKIVSVVSSV